MKPRFDQRIFQLSLAVFMWATPLRAADDVKTNSLLDGTWRWDFTMPDSGKITPTLRVKTGEGGVITGVTRFRAGTSTPVTNLTLTGSAVSFEVVRERDGEQTVTHYSGTLSGDKIKGTMVSTWTGQKESYDWEAVRYSDVEGTWKWRSGFPGGGRGAGAGRGGGRGGGAETTLTLKRDGEKLSGKLKTGRGDLDIQHGRFRKSEVSFHIERERDGVKSTNFYWGKLSGETIIGKSTSDFGEGVRTNDWRATRAD